MDNWSVKRRAQLLEARVDDETLALHVDSGTCYGFNATAARIWSLLEEPTSLRQIIAVLAAEYEIDAKRCAQEIADLLSELEADGLVEIDRVGPPSQ